MRASRASRSMFLFRRPRIDIAFDPLPEGLL
jgi:hypothetical protein